MGLQVNKRAISDLQAKGVCELITSAGQPITYKVFPEMGHGMHGIDPELYVSLIKEWAVTLPTEEEVKKQGVFAER